MKTDYIITTKEGERKELPVVNYPGDTYALYDAETDTYYNLCGQKLKRPEDYHEDNDGRYY